MATQTTRATKAVNRTHENFVEHRDHLCLSADYKRFLKRTGRKAQRNLSKAITREARYTA